MAEEQNSVILPEQNRQNQNQRDETEQNNPAPILLAEQSETLNESIKPETPEMEITEIKEEAASQKAAVEYEPRRPTYYPQKAFEGNAVFQIEADKIKPNPYQPRKNFDEESLKELAASIREFGVIQPIVVSKIEKETEIGTSVEYQLIAGERRLMAAKMVGMERVPAIVRRVSAGQEQMELAIVENIQRAALDPIETARAYARLQDEFRLTQREIAVRVGKSRETIANALRLLNLPGEVQEAVAKNQISESQARLLLMIDDISKQKQFFQDLLNKNISVRELRGRIKTLKQPAGKIIKENIQADPETAFLEEQLAGLLGAPVKIEKDGEKGKIIISFYSPEEIKGIMEKFK